MQMKVVVLLCGLVMISSQALAEDDCYGTVTLGKSRVQGIKTGVEDKFFAHRYIEGSYVVNGGSSTHSLGIGCHLNRYFAVELDRREGFRASVESRGEVVYKDFEVVRFQLKRFAEVEGYGLSVVGRYLLMQRLWITGRLGVLVGQEKIGVTSEHLPKDWSIVRERDGVLPILGAGLLWEKNRRLSFTVEHTWYTKGNHFQEMRGGIRYTFE